MGEGYGQVVRIATEAAQEAGVLLRQDFFKPGGPTGHADKALADDRAEELIRRRLLTATPDWSYRGEETGVSAGTEAHHVWLVDPNDATALYLEGWRGSAVSIALLRDGIPVLGVVYAFVAPDNGGDLFAWAEGCGPLWRNGKPVERAAWATTPSPHTVVIVSHHADSAATENLGCVAPGRYRVEASIAYRLALVAAGEGEAAVCLSHPGDWDYAGGHALLLGGGGALVDQDGSPVEYTQDGQSSTSSCFGGAPDLVRELAHRPWGNAVAAGKTFQSPTYGLCRPVRGEAIADNGLLQRAQGCWLGQLAGDALGSMVEFQDAESIRRRYPAGLREIGPSPVFRTLAGQPTDDSELALMLARTLLHDRSFIEENVAAAYGFWRGSGPFDIGGTIGTATQAMLGAKRRGGSCAGAARAAASRSSEANGALMRQSPLAIWGHALSPDVLDPIVRADTTLTHPHRVCQDASAAFIVALSATIRDGLDGKEAYRQACEWDRQLGASPAVTEVLATARSKPPRYDHNQGHVLIAVQNAFYQALHASSFEEGVVETVMGGGDTDTNAAIAGALLGAVHGARAIPSQWRQMILSCRPQQGAPEIEQPRPRSFWPVDALCVAERLLLKGKGDRPASRVENGR